MSGIKAVFFDMDDTLVLTGEADAKAYREVMQLAKTRSEQVPPACPCCQLTAGTTHVTEIALPLLRWMSTRF